MNFPLMILVGKAGVGKDTIAGFLAKRGGICIAQADPLKRFAYQVLGMSEHQLWGPSEARNAPDPRPRRRILLDADLESSRKRWLMDIGLVGSDGRVDPSAVDALDYWERTFLWSNEDLDKPLTPRHVLQTLGTEFGRSLNPSIWVDYAADTAVKLLETQRAYDRKSGVTLIPHRNEFVVITDGRFLNEVLSVKEIGGKAYKIVGANAELPDQGSQHASETQQNEIPDIWFDGIVFNDKKHGLEAAEDLADRIAPRKPSLVVPQLAFTVGKR